MKGDAFIECGKCQRPSCRFCGGRLEHDPLLIPHQCVHQDADETAFEGLKKGKDYQICPSEQCGIKIELQAACNAMRCGCDMQFCYVCGEPATEGSDHWTEKVGGCPRYNQPGANNARFDPRRPTWAVRVITPPRRNPLDLFDEPMPVPRGTIVRSNHGHPLPDQALAVSDPRHHPLALIGLGLLALALRGERRNAIWDAGAITPGNAVRNGERQSMDGQLQRSANDPGRPEPLHIGLISARRAAAQQLGLTSATITFSVDINPTDGTAIVRLISVIVEEEQTVAHDNAH